MRYGRIAFVLAALAGAVVSSTGGAASAGGPGEFTPDEHTTLLAHFDESVTNADYANGWADFGGSGATQTEGYYGKGIELRGLQYRPDFLTARNSRTPVFNDFGIWPRGNIDLRQGTYEFWFKVSPDGLKQNIAGQQVFFTYYYQPAGPGDLSWMVLNRDGLSWEWHTTTGDKVRGEVAFSPALDPGDWHHFAMSWSPGEWVFYIDGRAAYAHDMRGRGGPLLYAVSHKPLCMNGIAMDELRISNVVRYESDFEPAWRDAARPSHAWAGRGPIQRYAANRLLNVAPPRALTVPREPDRAEVTLGGLTFVFDRKSGFLMGFGAAGSIAERDGNGLLLWEDVDRKPQFAAVTSNWEYAEGGGRLSFEQRIGSRIVVRHDLRETADGDRWRVTLVNLTDNEMELEALLSLPVPLGQVREYFDMSCVQDTLSLPRRRDEYVFSLPFVAVAGARPGTSDLSIGLGIDPHTDLSALISEYIPGDEGATVRHGTRVVLDRGGEFTLDFRVFAARADYGVLNALDTYQQLFPDLYKQRPDVPIYSYMPVCRYFEEYPFQDLARQTHMGMQWGHGPDHDKGDENGTERYWNMPKDLSREDHASIYKDEEIWGSVAGLREDRLRRTKRAYDTAYTLRRSHYLPNWAAKYVIEDLYPEGILGGDPLVTGQYYDPGLYYVNEYKTPLGEHYKQLTLEIMRANARYSPGFINDMCHTSPIRFIDPIARRTPGRAFAWDRGSYLVGAFGHADRYRFINSFVDERGFRQSIWSDGGVVSYQLSAHSAADAIESYIIPIDFTGVELGNRAGRNLLGEKPMTVHYANESDWIGRLVEPTDLTPSTLRDWYRYVRSQEALSALRHGIYLPYDVSRGNQWMMEHNPILVESIVQGRKTVPAAKVDAPLFARRSGEGWDSFLVVGNEQPRAIASDVRLTNRFFNRAPIFGAYFGGEVKHQLGAETSTIGSVAVPARGMAAFKLVALLSSAAPATVVSDFSGDGISMRVTLTVEAEAPGELDLNPFSPLYEIGHVLVNGQLDESLHQVVPLARGRTRVDVLYRSRVVMFSADDLASVELLQDGKTNLRLVADANSEFDRGTAGMLNHFLAQYDEEDGIVGDLAPAPLESEPSAGFTGWTVVIDSQSEVSPSRVRIDRGRRAVIVEGRSPGEARRAMVVFMRLIDRKYPHIGRPFPIKDPWERDRKPWQYMDNRDTQRFFRDFSDSNWLVKPILSPELEGLYAGDRMDFQGTYDLRFAPYILEPTYSDDYVYGYTGD